MTARKAVNPIDFDKAKDLFLYLSPATSNWTGPRPEPVLYRGHWSAKWDLVPTALRRPNWLTDGGAWHEVPLPTTWEQVRAEVATLKYFFEESDRQGLRLPEDGQTLRQEFQRIENVLEDGKLQYYAHFWPSSPLLSLLGLAQHCGIATRLLDWSWDPYVAAYFAASGILRTDKAPAHDDRIAIWMLLLAIVETQSYLHGNEPKEWPVRVITAPTADNANLRAQRGVFTLHNIIRYKPAQSPEAPSMDDVLNANLAKSVDPDPPAALTRLTLPASEAPELLSLLSRQGYHRASLFPGFEGVADLLSERRKLQAKV